jgi:hypothetical protein
MTLGFYQTYPANLPLIGLKKTYFVFKIKKAIQLECLKHEMKILFNHGTVEKSLMEAVAPKLHTIREDKSNRWKPGTEIHFVINPRTKYRQQFLPPVKCTDIQTFEIVWRCKITPQVRIDGRLLSYKEVQLLSLNDGFTTLAEFFAYFNEDFTGKLIHWTHLKY